MVTTHEYIHALVDNGFFDTKSLEDISNAVSMTRTYANAFETIGSHYRGHGNVFKNEMTVRALAWFAMAHGTSLKIKKEVLAIWKNN